MSTEDDGSAAPSLSVVIPAYNEESRIGRTLSRVQEFLEPLLTFEVIVVDDGSRDKTREAVRAFADDNPRVRLLALPRNQGKGAAVRAGMLSATGDRILFMDADLATPIEEVEKFLPLMDAGADVVIGTRADRASDIRVRQPLPRELMGRGFNLIVRTLLLGGFRDTQCGFKLFTRSSAQLLFSQQTLDGFAFDVEILLCARQAQLDIKEVPVVWFHEDDSKVSPITDASRMFVDLVGLRLRGIGK